MTFSAVFSGEEVIDDFDGLSGLSFTTEPVSPSKCVCKLIGS